jgi:hypothetical protein
MFTAFIATVHRGALRLLLIFEQHACLGLGANADLGGPALRVAVTSTLPRKRSTSIIRHALVAGGVAIARPGPS